MKNLKLMPSVGSLHDDVGPLYVSTQLCIMGFATGILDAVSYPAFGIFLSNQTGNTIFLFVAALGLQANSGSRLEDTATSLGSFLLALMIFGQLGNHIGRRRRWWLLLSHAIQAFLVLLIALLEVTRVVDDSSDTRFVPITLLSVGSGMQVAMAKTLNCPEVPTAMLTSPYADLLTDRQLFTRGRSASRDRRIYYITCICSGVVVGAALYRYVSENSAVFVAAGVKIAITVSFLFNPRQEEDGQLEATAKNGNLVKGDGVRTDSVPANG